MFLPGKALIERVYTEEPADERLSRNSFIIFSGSIRYKYPEEKIQGALVEKNGRFRIFPLKFRKNRKNVGKNSLYSKNTPARSSICENFVNFPLDN